MNAQRFASHFSFEERGAALRTAALVLQVRQPCHQAYCQVRVGPNVMDAHAQWRWPGVVRVTLRWTGELVAESKPGKPFELAEARLRNVFFKEALR